MAEKKDIFTVYIVDDDDSVRTGLSRLMRASGLHAKAFDSAQAFLDQVTAAAEGCVLLDITMPSMSGLDLQRRLNERHIRLPVIALSARESDEVRSAARALGARFFLHKPADDQALLDAIAWVSETADDRNA